MDLLEVVVGIAKGTPLQHRIAETSVVVDFPRPPVGLTVAFVQVADTMPVEDITVPGDTTAVEDIMVEALDLASMHLTVIPPLFVIPRGSMTRTACGMSIPVAQFPTAIEAISRCGPSL